MNQLVVLSRLVFDQLLSHAPETLRRRAAGEARRAIPGLCFDESDILRHFADDARWGQFSPDEQTDAVEELLGAGEYDPAGAAANEAIGEAVANFLDEILGNPAAGHHEVKPR